MKTLIAAMALAACVGSTALADGHGAATEAPETAMVYVINLEDGATVTSPVRIKFGLREMGVAPAGIEEPGTGHHHILLNRAPFGEGAEDGDIVEFGIPSDDNHLHFGRGQTEAELDLPPGTHTIQLLLGDHFHRPHDPIVVSEVLTITVE